MITYCSFNLQAKGLGNPLSDEKNVGDKANELDDVWMNEIGLILNLFDEY